jgi:hypothetical protein
MMDSMPGLLVLILAVTLPLCSGWTYYTCMQVIETVDNKYEFLINEMPCNLTTTIEFLSKIEMKLDKSISHFTIETDMSKINLTGFANVTSLDQVFSLIDPNTGNMISHKLEVIMKPPIQVYSSEVLISRVNSSATHAAPYESKPYTWYDPEKDRLAGKLTTGFWTISSIEELVKLGGTDSPWTHIYQNLDKDWLIVEFKVILSVTHQTDGNEPSNKQIEIISVSSGDTISLYGLSDPKNISKKSTPRAESIILINIGSIVLIGITANICFFLFASYKQNANFAAPESHELQVRDNAVHQAASLPLGNPAPEPDIPTTSL